LIGLELDLEASRARLNAAIAAAGLPPGTVVVLRRDQGASVAYAVIEVAGFLEDDDARLAGVDAVLRPPVVLGAYAIPANGVAA
jgi:hypothetical protein